MERLIFLDIDGVLNNTDFLCTGKGFIDPELVAKLNQLSIYPDVKIVISSSWGYDNGKTEQSLKDCGLTIPVVGYTEHFHSDWLCRGNEIEKYLVDTYGHSATKFGGLKADTDYEFVILDDDYDMLLGQKDNFIWVNREAGLSDEDISNAIKILKIC